MPSDRFIGGENAVIDLETGISYSTVNDSEVVADLLNSLAAPEPVSGGVEVAAREALELAEEAMTYVSDHFRKKWSMDERRAKIAAALQNTPQPDEFIARVAATCHAGGKTEGEATSPLVREAWDRVDELQTYLSALDSLEGADHQNASCAGDVAVEIRELVKLRNAATEARGRAAASASPEPEGVVIDGDFETRTTINDDKPDESVTCLYVGDVEVGEAIADVAGTGEFYDNDGSPERTFGMRYGPVRLIITPIKERGDDA